MAGFLAKTTRLISMLHEFPKNWNREFNCRIREFSRRNREFGSRISQARSCLVVGLSRGPATTFTERTLDGLERSRRTKSWAGLSLKPHRSHRSALSWWISVGSDRYHDRVSCAEISPCLDALARSSPEVGVEFAATEVRVGEGQRDVGPPQSTRQSETVHQRRQERDQMDAAVVPQVPQQRGSALASRPGLQSSQLHADTGFAEGGGALLADQPTGEAGQDRCQGRPPWPVCNVPIGRMGFRTRPNHKAQAVGCQRRKNFHWWWNSGNITVGTELLGIYR